MEEAELRVLANMVVYPERAFDLVGRLGIRAEDFSVPSNRAAFAALVRKDAAPSEQLMLEVAKCSGEKKWTNAEIDAFRDLPPSLAEGDHECVSFAGALAMLSYLAGRKFTDARNTMPNLYLVALAGSAGGNCLLTASSARGGDRISLARSRSSRRFTAS